jgi:hypothetical protein
MSRFLVLACPENMVGYNISKKEILAEVISLRIFLIVEEHEWVRREGEIPGSCSRMFKLSYPALISCHLFYPPAPLTHIID